LSSEAEIENNTDSLLW